MSEQEDKTKDLEKTKVGSENGEVDVNPHHDEPVAGLAFIYSC